MKANPTAVVVDDEAPLVELVCDVLQDEGITAVSCPHGRRAFSCIRRKQPEVIILDIQMPEVDGIQVFQQLRADPETAAIPVIFFTANAHMVEKFVPDYAQKGARLLPKPFDVVKLIDMVEQALAS